MSDESTVISKAELHRPLRHRARRRHTVAAVTALALNAGLLAFLTTWRDTPPRAMASPLQVVPLQVVEAEPTKTELTHVQDVAATVSPPSQVMHLPVPALPLNMPTDLRLDTPPLPALVMADCDAISVPAFIAHLPPTPGVSNDNALPAVSRPAGGGTTETKVSADRGPVMLKPPNLSEYYPRRAKLRGVSGKTTVRLTIDSHGKVASVEVIRSTPAGVFEIAAGRLARSLTFLPARRDGKAVATTAKMNFVWKLD